MDASATLPNWNIRSVLKENVRHLLVKLESSVLRIFDILAYVVANRSIMSNLQ